MSKLSTIGAALLSGVISVGCADKKLETCAIAGVVQNDIRGLCTMPDILKKKALEFSGKDFITPFDQFQIGNMHIMPRKDKDGKIFFQVLAQWNGFIKNVQNEAIHDPENSGTYREFDATGNLVNAQNMNHIDGIGRQVSKKNGYKERDGWSYDEFAVALSNGNHHLPRRGQGVGPFQEKNIAGMRTWNSNGAYMEGGNGKYMSGKGERSILLSWNGDNTVFEFSTKYNTSNILEFQLKGYMMKLIESGDFQDGFLKNGKREIFFDTFKNPYIEEGVMSYSGNNAIAKLYSGKVTLPNKKTYEVKNGIVMSAVIKIHG